MREIIVWLTLAIVCQAADPREPALLKRLEQFASAWNNRSAKTMADVLTDDFLIISRTGSTAERRGFPEGLTAGRYSTSGADAKYEKPDDLRVRFYGDTGIVTYSREFQLGPSSNPTDRPVLHRFSEVWVRQGGEWKLANRHASVPPGSVPPLKSN